MSHSIAHGLRVAILPIAAIVVVACGGGGAAATQGTDESTGSEPAATSGEEGGGSSLAPAGARSYYTFDPTGSALVRVDPDNGQVDEVLDLEGSAYTMAQGEGALWFGMDSGAVLRVDPAAGSTIAEIAAPGTDTPFDLSVGNGAAWALYGVPGLGTSLVRIDPAANTGGEPITPDEGLTFFDVEAGDEGTWLVGSSPEMATTLYAVDPTTGELTDQKVQMVIDSIASGEGAVWLGGTIFPDGAVGVPGIGKFDPATGELTTTEIPGEAGSIAVGSGGVWAVAGPGRGRNHALPHRSRDRRAHRDDPARRGGERLREGLDRRGRRVGQHGRWRKLRGRSCRQLDRRRSRLDGDPRPVLPVGTARPAPVGISPAGASCRTRRSHR